MCCSWRRTSFHFRPWLPRLPPWSLRGCCAFDRSLWRRGSSQCLPRQLCSLGLFRAPGLQEEAQCHPHQSTPQSQGARQQKLHLCSEFFSVLVPLYAERYCVISTGLTWSFIQFWISLKNYSLILGCQIILVPVFNLRFRLGFETSFFEAFVTWRHARSGGHGSV
jgi:hypothetical protein